MVKEKRYYLVNIEHVDDNLVIDFETVKNEVFIDEAEKQGTVYSEKGFQNAFNNGDVTADAQFLRIIDVQI